MYDPCGTQRLEGDVIIKRLAAHLKVDPKDLECVLVGLVARLKNNAAIEAQNKACNCNQ